MNMPISVRFLLSAVLILGSMRPVPAQDSSQSPLVQLAPEELIPSRASAEESLQFVGQIGGSARAVAVRGPYAYVSCGSRLVVVDTSNPAQVRMVGQTALLDGMGSSIAVHGDYAYVAGGYLYVIDVSDPTLPTQVARFSPRRGAVKVVVAGAYAYVMGSRSGPLQPGSALQIINISDPTHPVEVGWFETTRSGHLSVALVGKYAYYLTDYALNVLDVSDPAHPTRIGSFEQFGGYGLHVVGNYAYVAFSGCLYVLDIVDPANPTLVTRYEQPDYRGRYGEVVAGEGNYVYLGDRENWLYVIDISDPAQPTQVGLYSTPGYTLDLAVMDGHLYLAKDLAAEPQSYYLGGGLHIISITDPTQPTEVGLYPAWGSAQGVSIKEDYAYVSNGDGLRVIDIADPANPNEVSFFRTESVAWDVSVEGNCACVADAGLGLRVLDISDPAHPREVGSYVMSQSPYRVAMAGDYAYVIDYQGLYVINLSDPPNLSLSSFHPVSNPRDLAVLGRYAYVASQNVFYIVDISDPAHPVETGSCRTASTRRLAIDGAHAYLTIYGNLPALMIIDITDPSNPTEVAFYIKQPTPSSVWGLAAKGTRVLVGVSYGLRTVDVSDMLHPKDVGFCQLPDEADDVAWVGHHAYVADSLGGLYVFQFTPAALYLPIVMRGAL
jgi:hypothetical protein